MQSVNEKYLFGKQYISGKLYYLIKRSDNSKSVWIRNGCISKVIKSYRQKISKSIFQDRESIISKEEIIENLIQQANNNQQIKKFYFPKLQKAQMKFHQKKNYSNLQIIFKSLKLFKVTKKIWNKYYCLMVNPESIQIIKKSKFKGYNFYLVKHKYFQDPKDYKWLSHYELKILTNKNFIQNFQSENNLKNQKLVNKEYQLYHEEILIKLNQTQKKINYTLIGKYNVRKINFYLMKSQKVGLLSSQWKANHRFKRKKSKFNEQIKIISHDCTKQPYFDRQAIKRLIIEENQKSMLKDNNLTKIQILDNQELDKKVQQMIKIFLKKLKPIKKDIYEYYSSFVPFFDEQSDVISISSLKQKILQKETTKQQAQIVKYEPKSQQLPINQLRQKIQVKCQFQTEDEYNDSQDSQKQDHFLDQNDFLKAENSQHSQFSSYDSQSQQLTKYQEDEHQFYAKVKQECKQQFQEPQKRKQKLNKKKNKKEKSIFYQNLTKAEIKTQKIQAKKETLNFDNEDIKVKQEDISTTFENSQEIFSQNISLIKVQGQCTNQGQKNEVLKIKETKKPTKKNSLFYKVIETIEILD